MRFTKSFLRLCKIEKAGKLKVLDNNTILAHKREEISLRRRQVEQVSQTISCCNECCKLRNIACE